MGTLTNSFELGREGAMNLPANVCVVASEAEIERLRHGAGARIQAGFECVGLAPSEAIPSEVIAKAYILVMEIDPADWTSLRRISQVRNARPKLPLIVALRDARVDAVRTLVRQGVNDVCALPFDADELSSQVLDLAAQLRDEASSEIPLAPLVSVVRSTGGSGATSVVTHLAAALASEDGGEKGACVIDLDIQFGNVGAALGRSSKTSVLDLLTAGERLDTEFLHSATVDSERGFDVIVAPDPITPLEAVDVDQLLHLLTIARQEYGSVVLDLPTNWTNWTLSTALASTDVLLVTDLTIPGLRQAKRRLDLFKAVGVPKEIVRIVVNRVEKRLFRTIGVDEVRDTLGHPVFATLSAEPNVISSAQDQGLLAWQVNRKSKFSSDIAAMAQDLAKGWRGR
jgi:pilus assembly protein CpaE